MRKLRISHVQQAVSEHYNIPRSLFLSKVRTRKIARPRQIAMMLAREYGTGSLPKIGKAFGGRDHTTVIHAMRVMPARIAASEKLQADLEEIRQRIHSGIAGNTVNIEPDACLSEPMCKMGSSEEGASA